MPCPGTCPSPHAAQPALRILRGRSRTVNRDHPAGQPGPALCTARVLDRLADHDGRPLWQVQPEDETASPQALAAVRAAGCLLEPAPGDLVLLMRQAGGTHYVLNVLEKEESACTLRFPGDVTVDASQGGCSIQARDVAITGQNSAALFAKELTLAGHRGRLRFAGLDVLARTLDARIERIKSVAEKIRLTASNLTSHVGRVLRLTGFELHRARSVRTEVDERFAVQAGQASILARDEVTVDAEKIHLG